MVAAHRTGIVNTDKPSPVILGADATSPRQAQRLILVVQARLLLEYAPTDIADAFIASRFDAQWGRVFGTLPEGTQHAMILDRAWPV